MSLVVYSLEYSQALGEKTHHVIEKVLNNNNTTMTDVNNKNIDDSDKKITSPTKNTVLDLRTCNEAAQTSSLLGMLENLKRLSSASQVAIESITREADKTFERVFNIHEKVLILTEKVARIKEFYDNTQYEEIQKKQIIQRVDYQEPDQGRFNSETIPDGWYEQYQKCEDMPNFKIVDEYLLKPPYLQSCYKNYSNPDGLFSTWKETFVRHLRNEQMRDREFHNCTPSQTQSMINLKKKHSVGDVITPGKRVKQMIPVWKKFDKNNGSKVKLKTEGAIFENIQQITISESQNSKLTRTRSSVLRSAGSQKKIDTSLLSPEESKGKSIMEEKMKTLLKKSRSQNNTMENTNQEQQPIQSIQSIAQNESSPPDSSPESQIPEPIQEVKESNIPPPPQVVSLPNIPPPPPVYLIKTPLKSASSETSSDEHKKYANSNVPPVPNIPTGSTNLNVSIAQSLITTATTISGKALLKPTSPREQVAKNDAVADLLDGIRKGIKLSRATERKLADKPAPKQSFDVFSVLKEKFKFANAEMSTDSFCPSASATFTEDW